MSHHLQRLANLAIRENVQKGGLLKFNDQCLFQGFVKHSVTSLVVEVGENRGVFVGEFGRAMEIEIAAQCEQRRRYRE
jgi:hypothetical protein